MTSHDCRQGKREVRQLFLDKSTATHHVVEDEAGVGEFEVFEEAVEFAAVQGAPGTVKVVSRLRLLPGVVVVQELHRDQSQGHWCAVRLKQLTNLTHVASCFAVVQTGNSFSSNFQSPVIYLIKYAELLPRLTLDLLFLCLNVCAG